MNHIHDGETSDVSLYLTVNNITVPPNYPGLPAYELVLRAIPTADDLAPPALLEPIRMSPSLYVGLLAHDKMQSLMN